jgi:preprotein translocase subunit SecD
MNRNYRNLIFIGILLALTIYMVLPNSPGIHIPVLNLNISGTQKLGLDLEGGLSVVLEADVPAGTTVNASDLQTTLAILTSRADALGVSGNELAISGNRFIVGEFPGATNIDQVINALKQVGQLAFVPLGSTFLQDGTPLLVDYNKTWTAETPTGLATVTPTPLTTGTPSAGSTGTPPAEPTTPPTATPTTVAAAANTTPPAATAVPGATATAEATPVTVYYPLMTGAALNASAITVTKDNLGNYQIAFTLKSDYVKTFSDFTSSHIGQYLAIVLDDKIISDPTINNAITDGSGVIQGSFTYDTANSLANVLRYGSLPIPMKVVQSRQVGATLGQDSINKSVVAGVIGLAMVIILMLFNYRLPGFLAVLALIVYGLTNFTLFKVIPVTLTLPGIAGFVLSIGMAVDANILIFERMKEELRAGRGLHSAIDLGWRRAWPSIRDSNISTLITCLILGILGSSYGASFVLGFAINLGLGVLVSLFTAIFVTRTFLHVVLDNLKFTEHPRWFGV